MTRWIRHLGERATVLLAVVGGAVAFVVPPAGLAASPHAATLCIVKQGVLPGLEAEILDGALALEQRKRGIVVVRSDADRPGSCPPASAGQSRVVLIVGSGGDVVLIGPSGGEQRLAIGSLEPMDRARELARQVIGRVPGPGERGPTPMVEGPLPPMMLAEAVRRPPAVVVRGYAEAGGRYEYRFGNGAHVGGLDAELGVSILEGRFELGARAGWLRAAQVRGAGIPVSFQAVPVEVVARGGPRFGRVLLRLGVAAGFEWRQMRTTDLPGRSYPARRTETVAAVGGEVEVAVDLVPGLRLAVAGMIRGFPGGTRYTWYDASVYDAPRVAAGASLRLVAVFPGGGR